MLLSRLLQKALLAAVPNGLAGGRDQIESEEHRDYEEDEHDSVWTPRTTPGYRGSANVPLPLGCPAGLKLGEI